MLLKHVFLVAFAGGIACDQPSGVTQVVEQTSTPESVLPVLVRPEAGPPPVTATTSGAWQLHFSPHGGCEQMVVALVNSARKSVRVQAYGFTSVPIAEALVRRQRAGLDVQGVFDRSDRTAKNSQVDTLRDAGAKVFIDAKHPIMHVKAMIIDGTWVELGSYNYTSQAENNAEDCYEEQSPEKASAFTAQWEVHKAHSEALQ